MSGTPSSPPAALPTSRSAPSGRSPSSGRFGRNEAGGWPVMAFGGWTLLVWATRIRNIAADRTLEGGERTIRLTWAVVFVALGLALVVVAGRMLLTRTSSTRTSSHGEGSHGEGSHGEGSHGEGSHGEGSHGEGGDGVDGLRRSRVGAHVVRVGLVVTAAGWLWRMVGILGGHHAVAFVVVHGILAAVSTGLGFWALRSVSTRELPPTGLGSSDMPDRTKAGTPR